MYIAHVLSHNGGWGRLNEEHSEACRDLIAAITRLEMGGQEASTHTIETGARSTFSSPLREFDRALGDAVRAAGWLPLTLPLTEGLYKRGLSIDGMREGVGVESALGDYRNVESVLFVKYPTFVNAGLLKIGIVIMPTGDLVEQLVKSRKHWGSVGRMELVLDRLTPLAPLPLKYPFIVLGISPNETKSTVREMTSGLDQYLVKHMGLTLMEMALATERPNYDFKEALSPDNHKTAKLACAYANHPGGGWMLVGVDNDGGVVGLLRSDLDTVQLRITNIVRDSCSPRPECSFEVVEMPSHPERCVLIVHVGEIERKPCLVDHRVYVRLGTESVPADSEGIRRLIVREA